MRKILYLQWDCFGEEYICDSFRRQGYDVEAYPIPYGKFTLRHDEDFERKLTEKLSGKEYEFVYSFNFFPAVALATYRASCIYVSWTYDSPFMYLYSKTIMLPTNMAFCFDKATVQRLQKLGASNVRYLPMAAPTNVYDKMYSGAKERKMYTSEVSFVGSLYTESRQDFMKYLTGVSPAVSEYLNLLIHLQMKTFDRTILEELLKPEILRELRQVCPLELSNDEMQTEAWMYANYFLARAVTAKERGMLLENIAESYLVKLYTPEPTPQYPQIVNCGTVDYCNEMPYVFKNSKINLNISLKSIESGIPLRVFDIMGCGGFVISDYQTDFDDCFIADEDYVYYTTSEDLFSKINFYLEKEDLRIRIAKNGYEKIKMYHTYDHRVKEIMGWLD